jgi:chromosomal replication initiator protein
VTAGRVSIERIKTTVAADYGVTSREIDSQRRHKRYIAPRHVAMYLACQLTPYSTTMVGRLFGRRDHTTILAAHRKIAALRERDIFMDGRLRRLERELEPPGLRVPELQLAFLIGPLFDTALEAAA